MTEWGIRRIKRAHVSEWQSRQERLQKRAVEMLERNLFQGTGCASQRAAIAKRLAGSGQAVISGEVAVKPGPVGNSEGQTK